MKVRFDKVSLHHFMSFGDSEVALSDRGFCLVEGINEDPRDASKSNGSGKSSIWNAICFALTGETIGGVRSNLPNKTFDDGCVVTLSLNVDGKDVEIVRSKDDAKLGTDLKIRIDGKDVSGKGVRESTAVLNETFPELTKELLGSAIILGQGLPQRFTDNTPSGRKEVLEHLSKSDFMIEDIKERLSKRTAKVASDVSNAESALASNSSKSSVYESLLEKQRASLSELENDSSSSEELAKAEREEEDAKEACEKLEATVRELTDKAEALDAEIKDAESKKSAETRHVAEKHAEFSAELKADEVRLSCRVNELMAEISKLKSITDVCPTCGQRIPNVVKPDTSKQEAELTQAKSDLEFVRMDIDADVVAYKEKLASIDEAYAQGYAKKMEEHSKAKSEASKAMSDLNSMRNKYREASVTTSKLRQKAEGRDAEISSLREGIAENERQLSGLAKESESINSELESLKATSDALSKMSTLVKRDFRGYLLQDVIKYINAKAKAYASKIFNTDDIAFEQDGNELRIAFLGKEYENLSGGEKQRVDLIVQFAIRDMMCDYSGFSCNILVLDEITDALDSVSCDRVIEFISSEMDDIESVFVISHHSSELGLPYDSTIKVRKGPDGVSEVIA